MRQQIPAQRTGIGIVVEAFKPGLEDGQQQCER
jgi:hypothetical protein